ncbi:MAG: hypothetical protein WAV76_12355 [Bacteroidota bacterium]
MFLISEILSVAAEAADVCLPAAGGRRTLQLEYYVLIRVYDIIN